MTETIPAPSGAGTVVLELGAGTGALILHAPSALDGREIEDQPQWRTGRGAHPLGGSSRV